MASLRQTADGFSRFIDCVAAKIVAILGRFAAARSVRLVEEAGGTFALQTSGRDAPAPSMRERLQIQDGKVAAAPASVTALLRRSRTELVLRPDRFVIRPHELPRRAAEFLDGIVRAQIDRLTPWSARDAAFGWSAPADLPGDRIVVTVAATARAMVQPLINALAGLGADAIAVSTLVPGESGPVAVKVLDERVRGADEVRRVRRAVVAVLLAAAVLAGAAIAADIIVGNELDARSAEVSRRVTAQRALLRAGRDNARDSGLAALERRRHETPSSVIVLEALSQILPDHTFVTELRIQGDRMQVIGVTRDAPSLIRLIEQSSHFTRATFFAPTTRSPSDPGEHFHIEARIEPVFTPRT